MQATGGAPSTKLSIRDKVFRKLTNGTLRDPLITATTDRDIAKTVMSGLIGRPAHLQTDAILRSAKEIENFDFTPGQWVRTTHSYVIPEIVSDRGHISRDNLIEWLNQDYYHLTREENYKPLKPGILVEPYVQDGEAPVEIRVLCYNGDVSLFHSFERSDQHHYNPRRYYTPDWEPLEFSVWDPHHEVIYPKPAQLDAFKADCEKISAPFEIVGIEALLYPGGEYRFIGLSHCPDGGLPRIVPKSATQEYNDRFFRLPPYGDTVPD